MISLCTAAARLPGRTGFGELQCARVPQQRLEPSLLGSDGKTYWFRPSVAEQKAVLAAEVATEEEKLISYSDAVETEMKLWHRPHRIPAVAATMELARTVAVSDLAWIWPSACL